MKIRIILIIFLSIFGTNCFAQKIERECKFSKFDEIFVDGASDIHIKQGKKQKVIIVADETQLDDSVVCAVNRGMLEIQNNSSQKINIYITIDSLHRIDVENNCRLYLERFKSSRLTVSVAKSSMANLGIISNNLSISTISNSSVILAVVAPLLDTRISGNSELIVSGDVGTHLCLTNGTSKLKAFELKYNKARILASEGSIVWMRNGQIEKLVNGAKIIIDDPKM